jgi:hypothetical protein
LRSDGTVSLLEYEHLPSDNLYEQLDA